MKTLVAGIGNELRGDDDAGLAVARLLRPALSAEVTVVEVNDNATSLMDHLAGHDVAIIIDAAQSASPPGTIHRYDASENPLPESQSRQSTHGITLGSILELARLQGELPNKVLVFGIEGKQFAHGADMSPDVKNAVVAVAKLVGGILDNGLSDSSSQNLPH